MGAPYDHCRRAISLVAAHEAYVPGELRINDLNKLGTL
jgi:hypothetical protein